MQPVSRAHGKFLFLGLLTGALIFAVDLSMPLGVAGAVPYVFVVLLSLQAGSARYTWGAALLTTALTFLGLHFSPEGGEVWKVLVNRGLALLVIWATAWLCLLQKKSFSAQAKLASERDLAAKSEPRLQKLFIAIRRSNSELAVEVVRRKRVEAAISESNAKLQAVLDHAADGVVVLDIDGKIESFNHAARTIFRQEQSVIGCDIRTFIPEFFCETQGRSTARDSENREPQALNRSWETMGCHQDGSTFPMELSVSEVELPDRLILTAILRDMTRSKRLESQLRQAQKLESIGQLAAGIAHEINTPTQFIGDNTHFLQEAFGNIEPIFHIYGELITAAKEAGVPPDLIAKAQEVAKQADLDYLSEEIPKAIEQSLEGIGRVSKIVRSMKEFSHPGTEEKTLADLNEAIASTVTVSTNEWKYVAKVETQFDPDLPPVPCLPGDFNQVILNMIVNAAHAIAGVVGDGAEAKGTITISTRRDGGWAEIRISDTGTGMPEEILSRIFDPFFTTKEVGKGTGQGLAISHAVIVERHGGTLRVESDVGKGTTFIIRLPLENAEASQETSDHAVA